jgi:hypothetical protein
MLLLPLARRRRRLGVEKNRHGNKDDIVSVDSLLDHLTCSAPYSGYRVML